MESDKGASAHDPDVELGCDGGMPQKADGEAGNIKPLQLVYLSYGVGLLFPLFTIIGLIAAYVLREPGDSRLIASHYRFLIRTFWIGLLYGVVGGLLSLVVIGWFVLIFATIWYIVRLVRGYKFLYRREPIQDPGSWMFGG